MGVKQNSSESTVRKASNECSENIKPISVFVEKDYATMSERALDLLIESIAELLICKEYVTIMPSVGGSTRKLYELLADDKNKTKVDWSRIVVLQMDDYFNLLPEDPRSLAYSICNNIIGPLGVGRGIFLSDICGATFDYERYDRCINELGGIDIAIHGIGENGHLGFNEPGSSFESTTRVVDLHASTLYANSRFFEGDVDSVPNKGVTVGMKAIYEAKTNYLLASSSRKRRAIKLALGGPIEKNTPASILQLHSDTTVIVDEDAS